MTLDPKAQAALALHRFGFGPRAGTIAAIASDPRGALLAELERPSAGRLTDPDLLTTGEAARAVFDARQERKAARLVERAEREAKAQTATPAPTPPAPPAGMEKEAKPEAAPAPKATPQPAIQQQIYLEEAKARFDAALAAELGFAERLVWFWSNHFCVSADKVRPLAGAYEREAIRAHVLGRFADMLLAVELHPAMLVYLDNARSIGPKSQAGVSRSRGLNENLAREILELHTVGVRSVYTQANVTNFAKIITGWTVNPAREPARGGEFVFNIRMHEPGAQSVIGKSYPDTGIEQGRAVLADLAKHPATAKHLATKLVRHFVADVPPPALVEVLTRRFLDTGGDLKEVAKALVAAPEAWDAPRGKLKRPGEWIASAMRATGVPCPISAQLSTRKTCSASRCGVRPRPRASLTTRRRGSTALRNASTSPTSSRAALPRWSIRNRQPMRRSGRSRPSRRGRRSNAPKAGRRRLPCC